MIKYIFISLSLFFSSHLSANEDPFVYRHDMVDPEDVFKIGFIVPGHNDNMYQHIRGTSCFEGDGSTRFISTSATENMTHILAEQNTPVGMTYYLYTIRPSDNFYSAESSLLVAYQRTDDARFYDTHDEYRHENEWLALGGISPYQILSARAYRSNGPGQQATYLRTHYNLNYRDEDTVRNTQPYFIPDLPANDVNDRTPCSICLKESGYRTSKRHIENSKETWLSCRYKIYISAIHE